MDLSLTGSPESCLHAVEDKVKSLESSVQKLKLHQNTIVPISRLPTEILSFIFSLLPSSSAPPPISHVCHLWREISLDLPYLWSHIDFTKLTPAGTSEMLTAEWSTEKFEAFKRQIGAHIHHTCYLSIATSPLHLLGTSLVSESPAPSLEQLTVTNISGPYISLVFPDDLFDGIAPKLIYLCLDNCRIRWESPLLKGLRDLRLFSRAGGQLAALNTWLDALSQMPQLERLSIHGGVRYYWLEPGPNDNPIEPGLSVVLSSLTELDISTSVQDCLAIIGHLVLPALNRLCVDAQNHCSTDRDVLNLLPFVARNAHGPQDTEPLQSLSIEVNKAQAEIVAWTMPRQDTDDCLGSSVALPDRTRLRVAFSDLDWDWHPGMEIRLHDAVLTKLPLNYIASLTVKGRTSLNKQVWHSHAPKWHKLERVRLHSAAVPAFREMLEDAPRGGTLLRSLKELVLINVSLNSQKVYYLYNMLIELEELKIPLRTLDLRTCILANRAVQVLSEIVADVQGPMKRESGNLGKKRRGRKMKGSWSEVVKM